MTFSSPLALRAKEAARALGISHRTLWQLTKDGHVPCVRLGTGTRKTILYPTEMLQGWLASRAKKTSDDCSEDAR
jgi:excisionase family DNA binding protein